MLLAPVTTLAHGVLNVWPNSNVELNPVKSTIAAPDGVTVPGVNVKATVETDTITPVPVSIVGVPKAVFIATLLKVTRASASTEAVPKAVAAVTPTGSTCVNISMKGLPIAKSN